MKTNYLKGTYKLLAANGHETILYLSQKEAQLMFKLVRSGDYESIEFLSEQKIVSAL